MKNFIIGCCVACAATLIWPESGVADLKWWGFCISMDLALALTREQS